MDEAHGAMGAVMDGEATPAQLAALLMGLRMRGETVDELAGFAAAMRERSVHVEAPDGRDRRRRHRWRRQRHVQHLHDRRLVTAAAGVPVAKHGNRAMTSKAGSADVLDALGIRIDHDAASAGAALREHGFAFMFAPNFHPAMRYAGPTRKEIGVRTAFNLIGPLTNPAGTRRQLLGVADPAVAARMDGAGRRDGAAAARAGGAVDQRRGIGQPVDRDAAAVDRPVREDRVPRVRPRPPVLVPGVLRRRAAPAVGRARRRLRPVGRPGVAHDEPAGPRLRPVNACGRLDG